MVARVRGDGEAGGLGGWGVSRRKVGVEVGVVALRVGLGRFVGGCRRLRGGRLVIPLK